MPPENVLAWTRDFIETHDDDEDTDLVAAARSLRLAFSDREIVAAYAYSLEKSTVLEPPQERVTRAVLHAALAPWALE